LQKADANWVLTGYEFDGPKEPQKKGNRVKRGRGGKQRGILHGALKGKEWKGRGRRLLNEGKIHGGLMGSSIKQNADEEENFSRIRERKKKIVSKIH